MPMMPPATVSWAPTIAPALLVTACIACLVVAFPCCLCTIPPHKHVHTHILFCPSSVCFPQTFGAPVIEAYAMTEAAHQMTSNPLPEDGEHKVVIYPGMIFFLLSILICTRAQPPG